MIFEDLDDTDPVIFLRIHNTNNLKKLNRGILITYLITLLTLIFIHAFSSRILLRVDYNK